MRWWILAWALCLGCGDDDGMPAADGGTDAVVRRDGGGMATLELEVMRAVPGGDPEPADGARAILEAPGGAMDEQTVGADGTVRFMAVDFDLGAASVTVYEDGYLLTTLANIAAPTVPFPLVLAPVAVAPAEAVLSGNVNGLMDATHGVVVSTTTGGFYNGDASYQMQVPVGRAGTLVAFELSGMDAPRGFVYTFHQAATADFPAPSADTMLDVDLSSAVTVTSVSGSIPTPRAMRAASALNDGDIFIRVSGIDAGGVYLGSQSRLAENGDRFDYDVSYVELASIAEPYTGYFVIDPPEQSAVIVPGWPASGPQEVDFLDPPTVLAPDFGVDLGWSEPVRWESVDIDDALSVIQVSDDESGIERAITIVLPGVGTARLPQLPSGVSVSDLFGGGMPEARVALCDPAGASTAVTCTRFANSRTFGVTP